MSEQGEALTDTATRSPHIIVVGNEKGGSGKTTTAMHVTAALLNEGFRVGTLDLDVRQRSLSRYIENRKIWVSRRAVAMPEHYPLEEFNYNDLSLRQRAEQEQFVNAMTHLRNGNDFIVVDSPGADSYLSRLGHAAADTLITPINESFIFLLISPTFSNLKSCVM